MLDLQLPTVYGHPFQQLFVHGMAAIILPLPQKVVINLEKVTNGVPQSYFLFQLYWQNAAMNE